MTTTQKFTLEDLIDSIKDSVVLKETFLIQHLCGIENQNGIWVAQKRYKGVCAVGVILLGSRAEIAGYSHTYLADKLGFPYNEIQSIILGFDQWPNRKALPRLNVSPCMHAGYELAQWAYDNGYLVL